MDTTHGSETDEEDNEDEAQEYLNKMTDDTNRKVETVFGKGVEVWKSFNGTIYADVNDKVKRKQRDEEVWGKKRKRGGADGQGKVFYANTRPTAEYILRQYDFIPFTANEIRYLISIYTYSVAMGELPGAAVSRSGFPCCTLGVQVFVEEDFRAGRYGYKYVWQLRSAHQAVANTCTPDGRGADDGHYVRITAVKSIKLSGTTRHSSALYANKLPRQCARRSSQGDIRVFWEFRKYTGGPI
ncbi:uncharacterized protein J4E79_008272 [Alternaria viburni]|uniref:uncharacterized protein n=1 Tax=Alternaria viburni TaxID=566460 RepID=UPI0020C3E38E|nr:uncharacterized protein J4E79_008272 [Alternaria viburni]KAI4655207.1 hypothetical protein J4E79_008272 [Alternaria viburni]